MNDLINRQAAIDLVRDVCDAILSGCGSHYDGEDEVYDDILEVDAILKCNKEIRIALQNMPSAQSEQRTGKWDDKSIAFFRKCSNCGCCILWAGKPFLDDGMHYKYCPECGAKMENSDG